MVFIAALAGGLAVVLGAFAAHALRDKLTPEQLQTFETGVRYQMAHALALLCVAWLASYGRTPALAAAGYAFVLGIALFSGSLYLLATRELLGLAHWRWLGPVTPLGGLCLIAGWAALAVAALRLKV